MAKRSDISIDGLHVTRDDPFRKFFEALEGDSQFRGRLTAVIVDEAHCIDEWGGDDFRPEYRQLERLRIFTGQEVPIVCCTATATTSTFNIIWKTLGYGNQPFWGLDVGCDRPNLFYITRPIVNPTNPLLDALFILPQVLYDMTLLNAIEKCILYFDSENACRQAVQFIRKCLPAHLRSCVQAFSSNMSEAAKKRCWELFKTGEIRIICATDASGMGCNIPNVKYIISFGIPKSVGTVAQRWGRAGRDRITDGVCLLLVPKWAFRPDKSAVAAHALQRGRQKAPETKADTLKHARLDVKLEAFLNIGSSEPPGQIILILSYHCTYFCDVSVCPPIHPRDFFAQYLFECPYQPGRKWASQDWPSLDYIFI